MKLLGNGVSFSHNQTLASGGKEEKAEIVREEVVQRTRARNTVRVSFALEIEKRMWRSDVCMNKGSDVAGGKLTFSEKGGGMWPVLQYWPVLPTSVCKRVESTEQGSQIHQTPGSPVF